MPPETEGDPRQRRLGRHAHRARRGRARPRRRPRPGHGLRLRAHPRRGRQGVADARLQPGEPARAAGRPRATGCRPSRGRRRGRTSTARPACTPFVRHRHRRHDEHRQRRPAQRPRRPRRTARACGSTSTAPTARRPGSRRQPDLLDRHRARRLASCSTRTSGSSSPTRSAPCSSATRACSSARSRSTAPTCATPEHGIVQFRERGPQLTRGARALKLWLSLSVFGLDAFKAAIAARHRARRARRADARASATAGRSSRPPRSAIVCFRRAGADDERPTRMVRAAVADGFAAPEHHVLDGRTVARLCTINPRTTEPGHRAHDRAPRAPRALRHLNTRHVAPGLSDLRRSAGGCRGSIGSKGVGARRERTQSLRCRDGGAGNASLQRRWPARRRLTVDDDGKDCPAAHVQDDPERDLRRRSRATRSRSAPATYVEGGGGVGSNGLIIIRDVTIKGAGADLVTIKPRKVRASTQPDRRERRRRASATRSARS